MIKILLGGSPCTFWSIAQTKHRETKPEGLGWELFENYLIAKEKFKPDIFLYENNKSAAEPIKQEIRERLGVVDGPLFEYPGCARYIEINSALVSAQNRQRFYVHNCGDVGQPPDRHIMLRDILETGEELNSTNSKARTIKAQYAQSGPANLLCGGKHFPAIGVVERIPDYGSSDKSRPVLANYATKGDGESSVQSQAFPDNPNKQVFDYVAERVGSVGDGQANRLYAIGGKSVALKANGGGGGAKTGLYAVPMKVSENTSKGYAEIYPGECVDLAHENSQTRRGRKMADKSNCLLTSNEYYQYLGTKDRPIYEVRDGKIHIKGREYPVKLRDGHYWVRKLTVRECARLQTMPDDYCRAVSKSQAYKCLGNGWTAEVILWILQHALRERERERAGGGPIDV